MVESRNFICLFKCVNEKRQKDILHITTEKYNKNIAMVAEHCGVAHFTTLGTRYVLKS